MELKEYLEYKEKSNKDENKLFICFLAMLFFVLLIALIIGWLTGNFEQHICLTETNFLKVI